MADEMANPRISEINPLGLTREVIIEGFVNEWEWLCHDEDDATPEERRSELEAMTMDELIEEVDREGKEDWETFWELHCH